MACYGTELCARAREEGVRCAPGTTYKFFGARKLDVEMRIANL